MYNVAKIGSMDRADTKSAGENSICFLTGFDSFSYLLNVGLLFMISRMPGCAFRVLTVTQLSFNAIMLSWASAIKINSSPLRVPLRMRASLIASGHGCDEIRFIQPTAAEEVTASGIIIPDTAKEKPMRGKVIAVGAGTKDDEMVLKAGDEVLYGKYAGSEIDLDGEKMLIMRQSEVMAVVE